MNPAHPTHENILTMKISRFTVVQYLSDVLKIYFLYYRVGYGGVHHVLCL